MLIGFGVTLQVKPDFLPEIPISFPNWVNKATPVTAIIFEETKDKSKLPASQDIVLALASGIGVRVLDVDILGKAKEPVKELETFLAVIKDQKLPVLVIKWSNGKITAEPCPLTFEELKKRIG